VLAELVEETIEETHGGREAIRGFEDQEDKKKREFPKPSGARRREKTRLNHANGSSWFAVQEGNW
jgi:hypothetical protein